MFYEVVDDAALEDLAVHIVSAVDGAKDLLARCEAFRECGHADHDVLVQPSQVLPHEVGDGVFDEMSN